MHSCAAMAYSQADEAGKSGGIGNRCSEAAKSSSSASWPFLGRRNTCDSQKVDLLKINPSVDVEFYSEITDMRYYFIVEVFILVTSMSAIDHILMVLRITHHLLSQDLLSKLQTSLVLGLDFCLLRNHICQNSVSNTEYIESSHAYMTYLGIALQEI